MTHPADLNAPTENACADAGPIRVALLQGRTRGHSAFPPKSRTSPYSSNPSSNASHQVLILSTDTEVDRDYYRRLQPHVARAYHLRYDEAERVTVPEAGYFWSAEEPAGVRV